MKKKWGIVLKGGISISLIGLLIWLVRGSIGEIAADIRTANKVLYLLGAGILILAVIPVSLRLKIILNVQGISLSLKDTVYLSFIGYFFNNFLNNIWDKTRTSTTWLEF